MKSIGKRIANRVLSSTPSADAGAAQFLRSYTHALDWDIDADNAESANAVAAKGFLQSFAASYDWGQDAKPAEALVEQFLIAPDDFVEGLVGLAQQSIRNGAPDVARSVAFSLLETPLMREAGAVMLGVVACARKLWPFASDNFGMCSDETLIRYQFANAVSAFSRTGSSRAQPLLKAALSSDTPLETHIPAEELLLAAYYAAMFGDQDVFAHLSDAADRCDMTMEIQQRWGNLRREFAAQTAVGETIGQIGYDAIFGATKWTPADDYDHDHDAPIKVGIFNYRNPTRASTNIGDHVQSIGALGQLTAYDFENLTTTPRVRSIIENGAEKPTRKVERPVEVMGLDRDFSMLQHDQGTVWLPVCGWFAHPIYSFKKTLPFAKNIIPIFMSFHVSNYDIFDDDLFTYLKAHEPIGCRDMITVRTLREKGVSAFFNGCVTLTLGNAYAPYDGEREGRYYGVYKMKDYEPGSQTVVHLDATMWEKTFEENIVVADDMLRTYRKAKEVSTPLLHCLLPCRAMGTPVEFTNKKEGDPRFEGLVDADPAERARLKNRFDTKFQAVFDAIFDGKSRDEVYAIWRDVCQEDVDRTTAQLNAVEVNLPDPVDPASLPTVDSAQLHGTHAAGSGQLVDLLFAFDEGYTGYFHTVLEGIVSKTERPLRVNILGRGLDDARLASIAQSYPNVQLRHFNMDAVDYGDVDLMSHISISTMDRLAAPEIITDAAKLVYLDVDILVRGDVSELFDLDYPGHSIAGRTSIDLRWREGRIFVYKIPQTMDAESARMFREVTFSGGHSDFHGFNAGVLWLDLDLLRAQKMTETTTKIVKRFGLNDQYALNFFVRGERGELPREWNHYVIQEHMPDAKIVHFIGPVKPWDEARRLPFIKEWQRHAANVATRVVPD